MIVIVNYRLFLFIFICCYIKPCQVYFMSNRARKCSWTKGLVSLVWGKHCENKNTIFFHPLRWVLNQADSIRQKILSTLMHICSTKPVHRDSQHTKWTHTHICQWVCANTHLECCVRLRDRSHFYCLFYSATQSRWHVHVLYLFHCFLVFTPWWQGAGARYRSRVISKPPVASGTHMTKTHTWQKQPNKCEKGGSWQHKGD